MKKPIKKKPVKVLPQPKMQPLPKPPKRVKVNPVGKLIKSKKLTNRVQLTDDQYKRAKGMAGGGEIAKYNPKTKKLELSLVKKLALAKAKAAKFFLFTDQIIGNLEPIRLYLTNDTTLSTNRKEALLFVTGFDQPSAKICFYNSYFAFKSANGSYNLNFQSGRL